MMFLGISIFVKFSTLFSTCKWLYLDNTLFCPVGFVSAPPSSLTTQPFLSWPERTNGVEGSGDIYINFIWYFYSVYHWLIQFKRNNLILVVHYLNTFYNSGSIWLLFVNSHGFLNIIIKIVFWFSNNGCYISPYPISFLSTILPSNFPIALFYSRKSFLLVVIFFCSTTSRHDYVLYFLKV